MNGRGGGSTPDGFALWRRLNEDRSQGRSVAVLP